MDETVIVILGGRVLAPNLASASIMDKSLGSMYQRSFPNNTSSWYAASSHSS